MRKRIIIVFLVLGLVLCFSSVKVLAISATQKEAITNNCEAIKDNLRNIQKFDAKARVFLGSHYEMVYSKFMKPLNLRLVENNMSETELNDNQKVFYATKLSFSEDFISYQKGLEELVAMDCKAEPEAFYDKLVSVRKKRAKMVADVTEIRKIITQNVNLVKKLKERL